MAMKALVGESDPLYGEIVAGVLRRAGWNVLVFQDGEALRSAAGTDDIDLIVLECALDRAASGSIAQALKGRLAVPVILLGRQEDESYAVDRLEDSAEFYLIKPFEPRLLYAAIRAVGRWRSLGHPPAPTMREIEINGLVISFAQHQVRSGSRTASLTAREIALLNQLLVHRGLSLSRRQLAERAWGMDHEGEDREVDVYVRRLRAKIEPDPKRPRYILTDRGFGYRFGK